MYFFCVLHCKSLHWTLRSKSRRLYRVWCSFGKHRILWSNGKKTGVLRQLVCFLIDSDALGSLAVYGSVYGLVVITAERYFKIVHPVAHRNHYRRWMTYLGVATPWLIGLITSSVPSLTTAAFVDGTCKIQVRSISLIRPPDDSQEILYFTRELFLPSRL